MHQLSTTDLPSNPNLILKQMLSTEECLIPSGDSNIERPQGNNGSEMKQIGAGQCGTIWAIEDFELALKTPNPGKIEQLQNDASMHLKVQEALANAPYTLRRDIAIPRFHALKQLDRKTPRVCPDDDTYLPSLSHSSVGLLSERIWPVQAVVREALVDVFAPRKAQLNKKTLLAQHENENCLIRLYLGRRGDGTDRKNFKLQNFDLMANEMEYIGLDLARYARVMAQTLALLHWKVGIDANDVEFVIGRSPAKPPLPCQVDQDNKPFQELRRDEYRQSLSMWLLDFDQCKTFTYDEQGLKQLEKAFYFNDPYYPRPASRLPADVALWKVFKKTYLSASLELTDIDIPRRFIEAVEAEGVRRGKGNSLFG